MNKLNRRTSIKSDNSTNAP